MTALETFAAISDSYGEVLDTAENITVPIRLADIRALIREAAPPKES